MIRRLAFITALFLILGIVSGCKESKYPVGKDTAMLIGDGKFQLGRFVDGLKLEVFVSNHSFLIVEENVKKYKKVKNTLYVVGDSLTVVFGETNVCKLYSPSATRVEGDPESDSPITYISDYDSFTSDEKKVFESLTVPTRTHIQPVLDRFPSLEQIDETYWQADSIGENRFGPSSYWMKGYAYLKSGVAQKFKNSYVWSDVTLTTSFPLVNDEGQEHHWKYSDQFNNDIKSLNYIGNFYFDIQNELIYFEIER
ncbi:hypothetical protein [Cohnella sp. GCM10012308]|uniref:hypothetical protein n=1 Tax=Cohnella sp. GCM10012308 TaxID=3317329 RepID=UPI00361F16FD